MFAITGNIALRVEKLKQGNEITQTMPSGALIIGETVTPFILQRQVRGNINELNMEEPESVTLTCFDQSVTAFTKQGYVSLLLIIPHRHQFHIYIKKEWLKDFYAAFCMASISSFIK
jgi:hypothetical protein